MAGFTTEDFLAVCKELPLTTPGPSGLSYTMVKKSAQLFFPILVEAFDDLCCGACGPSNWMDSRLVFIPKHDG
eukprot:2561674-Amphidinium_carterae.1